MLLASVDADDDGIGHERAERAGVVPSISGTGSRGARERWEWSQATTGEPSRGSR